MIKYWSFEPTGLIQFSRLLSGQHSHDDPSSNPAAIWNTFIIKILIPGSPKTGQMFGDLPWRDLGQSSWLKIA